MQRSGDIFKLQDSGDVLSEEQQSQMEAQEQDSIFLGNPDHDEQKHCILVCRATKIF
jgi:hypothetical protein